jgi:hypothetical protein
MVTMYEPLQKHGLYNIVWIFERWLTGFRKLQEARMWLRRALCIRKSRLVPNTNTDAMLISLHGRRIGMHDVLPDEYKMNSNFFPIYTWTLFALSGHDKKLKLFLLLRRSHIFIKLEQKYFWKCALKFSKIIWTLFFWILNFHQNR